jgi:hypothetical protein
MEGTFARKEYRLSRLRRLDFHGAIHLVRVRGKDDLNIFFDASVLKRTALERWRGVPHLLQFLKWLGECCSECSAQLFGYCIEPNDASLVLKTMGAPLEICMQRLGGRYSRYLHAQQVLPKAVSPFAARYESKVIAPEYLPHALRRVHARAVLSGLARRAVDYPFSSAPAYLGARAQVRLEMDPVWRSLERKGLFGLRGYREFMEKAETPHVNLLFEQGSALDERVVGSNLFIAQVRDAAAHPSALPTREQLLAAVGQIMGAAPDGLFTPGHQAVLARALVAWYAARSGTASVRQVGAWFGVSGATLGKGIRHHRRVSPELFENNTLPGIPPADESPGEESD